MKKETKSKTLGHRITPTKFKAFHAKAAEFGGASNVLETLTDAFLENRLRIETPPVDTKWKELFTDEH